MQPSINSNNTTTPIHVHHHDLLDKHHHHQQHHLHRRRPTRTKIFMLTWLVSVIALLTMIAGAASPWYQVAEHLATVAGGRGRLIEFLTYAQRISRDSKHECAYASTQGCAGHELRKMYGVITGVVVAAIVLASAVVTILLSFSLHRCRRYPWRHRLRFPLIAVAGLTTILSLLAWLLLFWHPYALRADSGRSCHSDETNRMEASRTDRSWDQAHYDDDNYFDEGHYGDVGRPGFRKSEEEAEDTASSRSRPIQGIINQNLRSFDSVTPSTAATDSASTSSSARSTSKMTSSTRSSNLLGSDIPECSLLGDGYGPHAGWGLWIGASFMSAVVFAVVVFAGPPENDPAYVSI